MSNPALAHPAASRAAAGPLAAFLAEVRAAIEGGQLGSLVLSKPRHAGGEPRAVRVRLIALKGTPALSFVATHATRDVTRNLGVDAGIAEIAALLGADDSLAFAHATLHAAGGDTQLLVSKKARRRCVGTGRKPPRQTPTAPKPAAQKTIVQKPTAQRPSATTPLLRTTACASAACRSTCRS